MRRVCRYAIMLGEKCIGHSVVDNIGGNEERAISYFLSMPIGKKYNEYKSRLRADFVGQMQR